MAVSAHHRSAAGSAAAFHDRQVQARTAGSRLREFSGPIIGAKTSWCDPAGKPGPRSATESRTCLLSRRAIHTARRPDCEPRPSQAPESCLAPCRAPAIPGSIRTSARRKWRAPRRRSRPIQRTLHGNFLSTWPCLIGPRYYAGFHHPARSPARSDLIHIDVRIQERARPQRPVS